MQCDDEKRRLVLIAEARVARQQELVVQLKNTSGLDLLRAKSELTGLQYNLRVLKGRIRPDRHLPSDLQRRIAKVVPQSGS